MTTTERSVTLISIVITLVALPTKGSYRDDSKAVKISGGEDHTLVLTADKGAWACGPNGGYHEDVEYYWGVLGTGNGLWNHIETSLLRVHDGMMNTESERLEDINDIDAGWKHSLALDVTGFVWSWGFNSQGQLGIGNEDPRTTPVQVFRGGQPQDPCHPSDYLKHIIRISAGRSGQHSLAIDVNNFVYAWGRNQEGQCGNGESDSGARELTPVLVLRGEQADDPNDANKPIEHILDICAGADQSIALEKDDPGDPNFNGCVYTWGTNMWGDDEYEEAVGIAHGWGLLGNASDVNFTDTPVRVLSGEQDVSDANSFLKHITAVGAGWNHCIALEKDDPYDPNIYNPAYTGRVFTWGHNGPGWGGGDTGEEWERSVGGKKIFKIPNFWLDMEAIFCFSA